MSEQVLRAIRDAVASRGPITFAEFMELALYGPGGFYERPPVGAEGDFVTSPHVHPVFAELLARALDELWLGMGRPDPWHLVEVGAGDGTLAGALLGQLGDRPVRYAAVEVSSGAREALAKVGIERVLTELDGPADTVLANELLDNLPFRVVRGGREVRVGVEEGRPAEVLAEPDDELLAAIGAADGGAASGRVADGGAADADRPSSDDDIVAPIGALAFVDRLAAVLPPRGYALLIDYGGVGSGGGPMHGYRGHAVVEDVLLVPGTTDITAGVDLALIAERAEAAGLVAFPSVSQHDALMALGFETWFREQLDTQREQLDARAGLEAVRTWSGRSRASLLADPGGLGRFRWLLLATPGLPAPPWLRDALGTAGPAGAQ